LHIESISRTTFFIGWLINEHVTHPRKPSMEEDVLLEKKLNLKSFA
jgi:hypothetical protein